MNKVYAQTNIHLYQQLRGEGYSIEDVGRVCRAYELARELFSCQYRPSGKTLIAHLVGLASILGTLHVPCELVVAGLLHAAYAHGDFGGLRTGISDQKRRKVREVTGEIAETYVAGYSLLTWNHQTMLTSSQNVSNLSQIERNVLVMRLANELEDHLDSGILYCSNAIGRQKGLHIVDSLLIELAALLGYPALGAELERAFCPTREHPIPIGLTPLNANRRCMLRIPLSYRQRLPHRLFKWMPEKLSGFRSVLLNLSTKLPHKAKRFQSLWTR